MAKKAKHKIRARVWRRVRARVVDRVNGFDIYEVEGGFQLGDGGVQFGNLADAQWWASPKAPGWERPAAIMAEAKRQRLLLSTRQS
jgi:hypothetical protein